MHVSIIMPKISFKAVADEIDPYLAEHGALAGVLILAKAFPGWLNLEAAIAHLR